MPGTPFSSRKEVSASPTPSSMMTSSALKAGLARRDCAAARTAFCSAGVYARRACCTRLLNCASTESGNITGALGHEIDTHALGTDQLYHLLDLLHQYLRCISKQQVCLIEEKIPASAFPDLPPREASGIILTSSITGSWHTVWDSAPVLRSSAH